MGEEMYWVLSVLLSYQGETITAKQVSDQLLELGYEVGVRGVLSHVRKLNDFFYEWIQDDLIQVIKKSGMRIQHDFFSDGELQFLLDSIMFHQDLRIEDKEKLSLKLLHLSSYHQKQRLISFNPIENEHSFSLLLNLSTIMKAIEKKNLISFEYINYEVYQNRLKEVPSNKGNKETHYIFSPYQIVNQNNHYYVVGYNQLHKNQLTTYRIDRMRYIQIDRGPYIDIQDQFYMSEEISSMMNMFNSTKKETLKLECDYKILREMVSKFGKNIQAKKLYSNRYLLTIQEVQMSEGLIGWLFMLQDQVKVLEPLSLKEDMIKRIDCIKKMYSR